MRSTRIDAAVAGALARVGRGLYGVACSGGADSVVLADAMIEAAGGAHVVVMVVDHGMQAESAEVAARVARWARGRGAAALVRRVVVGGGGGRAREAAARDARYAALGEMADEVGCEVVLLGHTARDQAETVLMRVIRGTGPAGLAAMAWRRERWVRPLLDVRRADIEAYAAARGLPVWEDPMNEDRAVARVRVRREVMPRLAEENPGIEEALVRLAASAAEWVAVVDAHADGFAWPVGCAALAREMAAVRKRVVARGLERAGVGYDAAHLDAVDAVVCAARRGTVAIDLPGGRVVRVYDELEIEAAANGERRTATGSGERRTATGSGERGTAAGNGERRTAAGNGERQTATANGERQTATANGERQTASENGERQTATANGERLPQTANGERQTAAENGERQTAKGNGGRRTAAGNGERGTATANGERQTATANGERQTATANRPPDPLPAGHVLRLFRPGDRMRPSRLRGRSRKLSDLFSDLRVPRALRASARVLVRTSDDEIVWAEHIGT